VSRTERPLPQPFSAVWIRVVSREVSLGTVVPLVAACVA